MKQQLEINHFESLNEILAVKTDDRQQAIKHAFQLKWADGYQCAKCDSEEYFPSEEYPQIIICKSCQHSEYVTGFRNVDNYLNYSSSLISFDENAEKSGERVFFSAFHAFLMDGSEEDLYLLGIIRDFLKSHGGRYGLYIGGDFSTYIHNYMPEILENAAGLICDRDSDLSFCTGRHEVKVSPDDGCRVFDYIFLLDHRFYRRQIMRQRLGYTIKAACPDVLLSLAQNKIPEKAWLKYEATIYPAVLPEIHVPDDTQLVLLDAPGRMLAGPPIGLGYVNKALKKVDIPYCVIDLDTVAYHRYHVSRIFDSNGPVLAPNGDDMGSEPWAASNEKMWVDEGAVEYFAPEMDWIIEELLRVNPKVLGISVHQLNMVFFKKLVARLRDIIPNLQIVVGGFTANNPDAGPKNFPDFDYMVINEADDLICDLMETLVSGQKPKNLLGVISRYDDPDHLFKLAPLPAKLDEIGMPDYGWADLDSYRAHNGYIRLPIISSRGCKWSNCTFCSERFFWRVRSPHSVVDEMEWHFNRGMRDFMFQESDFNGRPELIEQMCDEIVARNLDISLTGQNRINSRCGPDFYPKMKAAGFNSIRFGVDAWARNTLRLQRKGYTKETIRKHLIEATEAGIKVDVNVVIGVPGETESDVQETIDFLLEMKPYIHLIANINPLGIGNGSIYWEDPEAHNIHFNGNRDELFAKNLRYIEPDKWYSLDPFIDQEIRMSRFKQVVSAVTDAGMNLMGYAIAISAENIKRSGKNTIENEEYVKDTLLQTEPSNSSYRQDQIDSTEQSMIHKQGNRYYRVV